MKFEVGDIMLVEEHEFETWFLELIIGFREAGTIVETYILDSNDEKFINVFESWGASLLEDDSRTRVIKL